MKAQYATIQNRDNTRQTNTRAMVITIFVKEYEIRMAACRGGFNRSMQHNERCVSGGSIAMKQRRRIYYSETQKALMWERWRKGESLQKIAQLFDRNHSSVQGILAETGGIQPP
ncbi:hypothetical protein CBA19CS11_30925 [Caballeronia novacaledonica]|nr:hypothetical protein CBA19CS11_30925 [Caballeronia novacaledonica]